jgi:phytoene dehydrogenase-like protein
MKMWLHAMTAENMPGTGMFLPIAISSMGLAGLAVGGSISLPRSLARLLESHGGSIITNATVREITVRAGRAEGVVLEDGRRFSARRFVVSAVDAPQTMSLVGRDHFPNEVAEKLDNYQWGAHTIVSVRVALSESPRYASATFDPDINRAFNIVMSPLTAAEVNANFAEVDAGNLPSRPMGNGACDSLFDPSYAPAGKHSAFWWPWARYDLAEGGADAWDRDDVKQEITSRILRSWREYAPNMDEANILRAFVFTPLDYSRRVINMQRGGMRVGAYYEGQIGIDRPHALLSSGRTPIEGLFLAGSSTGSGGGINGAPGYVAASQMAVDANLPFQRIDPAKSAVERLSTSGQSGGGAGN